MLGDALDDSEYIGDDDDNGIAMVEQKKKYQPKSSIYTERRSQAEEAEDSVPMSADDILPPMPHPSMPPPAPNRGAAEDPDNYDRSFGNGSQM